MKALIFDTETTGTDETAEIIEAAWIEEWTGNEYCERFKPTGPISFGAMAVHNIMMHDLEGCKPSSAFTLPVFDYLIGHNIDFDWKMAGQPDVRRICTLALSRYLWPELDSHKQAAVMYFLFGAEAQEIVQGAHNALEDVRMCRMILQACLGTLSQRGIPCNTLEEIWQASEVARIPTVMAFGKHKGTAIKDVPRDYVQWYLRQTETDPYLVKAFTERR